MAAYKDKPADKLLGEDDTEWTDASKWSGGNVGGTLTDAAKEKWQKVWKTAWTIGDYYIPNDDFNNYVTNGYTNLTNDKFVRTAEMDDRDYKAYTGDEGAIAKNRVYERYNTNVIISEGATVSNYAYGGGKGKAGEALSGGIYGTTYIALLGGKVEKDIYAACTSGQVVDVFGVGAYDSNSNPKGFTASANAYIQGGSVRNVYGAGWKGNVGSETIDGETHVVIGLAEEYIVTDSLKLLENSISKHSFVHSDRIAFQVDTMAFHEQSSCPSFHASFWNKMGCIENHVIELQLVHFNLFLQQRP